VARYNATNRWTDSLGIPQEGHRDYLTPTAAAIQKRPSGVAPLPASKASAVAVDAPRPELEPRAEVERRLTEARSRKPRFPLLSEAEVRQVKTDLPPGPVPAYIRLLAHFPKTGVGAIQNQLNLEQFGNVTPLLKARIAWVAARHDHAWYVLDHARAQLRSLGQTDNQIFALDTLGGELSEGDRLALQLTRKLTVTPQWITDDDIAGLRKHFPDAEVAEIVYRITQAAQFNRLTEAAGLPCDSPAQG
jgi:alkylhydroperoxidase family enzyme